MLLFPNGTTRIIASGPWYPRPGYQVAQVDLLAYDFGKSSMIYAIALLQKTDSKVEGPQWMIQLREYQLSPTSPEGKILIRNWIVWKITNEVVGDLRFQLAPQPGGFDLLPGSHSINLNVLRPTCSSWNLNRPSRVICMLSDAKKVSIIGLPSFPLTKIGKFEINMTKSIVFEPKEDEEIVKADLLPECFSVPNATSSAMVVTATVKKVTKSVSVIYFVRLDEFSQHSAYCTPPALPDNLLRNLLVHRQPDSSCVEVSISQCPMGLYFDGTPCIPRSITSQPLSYVVGLLSSSVIPQNKSRWSVFFCSRPTLMFDSSALLLESSFQMK
jgi:hypothetical protein